jgi:hypothetical protein
VAFLEDDDAYEEGDEDGFDHLDDEADETVPCPHCREPVYEDAERCPHCGQYLSREDAPRRTLRWRALEVVIAVLTILAVLAWVLSRVVPS